MLVVTMQSSSKNLPNATRMIMIFILSLIHLTVLNSTQSACAKLAFNKVKRNYRKCDHENMLNDINQSYARERGNYYIKWLSRILQAFLRFHSNVEDTVKQYLKLNSKNWDKICIQSSNFSGDILFWWAF